MTSPDICSLSPLRSIVAGAYKEQRMAYYSAVSIERSVRDIFDDGEDEFDRLKGDAWHGINTTYWKDYEDGYTRLNAVLEKITSTTLDYRLCVQLSQGRYFLVFSPLPYADSSGESHHRD